MTVTHVKPHAAYILFSLGRETRIAGRVCVAAYRPDGRDGLQFLEHALADIPGMEDHLNT